ncbi:amidohydrolase family protein [Streptomyces sp. NPDC001410]|uniref:amidohydrolase family protein n=1 Tax=Streptomyces sp. NPDC001410 TaxID=3364574 RepID=UPI003681D774
MRDCAVTPDDYAVLPAAREARALNTRVRALISALGLTSKVQVEDLLDTMEDWRDGSDPWLQVWGVKFGLDGGLEAGATEEPYACDHAFSGTLTWDLGVPVTIQQPLLHDTAEVEEGFWGPERVARLFPARGWLDLGAQVSAGSDFPVGQFGVMRSVWGLTTRQTVIGVKGPEHAITYDEALTLHTTQAARLCGEENLRGTLTPGRLADRTIWDQDPALCHGDALRDLNPTHTVVGGLLVTPAGMR